MHLWQWSVTNCRINQIEQAIQTCDNFLVNKKLFLFIKYDFQFSQLEKGGKKIEKWSSLILFPRGKHCEQFIPDFFVSFTKNLDPINLDPFRSLTSTIREIGFEGTDWLMSLIRNCNLLSPRYSLTNWTAARQYLVDSSWSFYLIPSPLSQAGRA